MAITVPQTLQTDRLTLRGFEENDWRAIHEHYSDEVCTRFTFGRALTEGESWRAVASMAGHWNLRGYGPYVVTERVDKAILGVVGLWYPPDCPAPEIKWLLLRRYWGRGYAREAAQAVQQMAASYLPDLSLISFIDRRNEGSIKVAKSLGATYEKEVDFRNGRWHVYRHTKL